MRNSRHFANPKLKFRSRAYACNRSTKNRDRDAAFLFSSRRGIVHVFSRIGAHCGIAKGEEAEMISIDNLNALRRRNSMLNHADVHDVMDDWERKFRK